MKRSVVTILLATLLIVGSLADNTQAETATLHLDEAIAMAMAQNHHIQSLQAGSDAQASQARSEKHRWLGEVMLNGGMALHDEGVLIRPITQDIMMAGPADMPFDDQYMYWNLAYRVPLYNGGATSGMRESTRLSASASRMSTQRAILGIRHQVLVTYVGILSLDAQLSAWHAQKEALDSLLGHIEMGQDAGRYSHVDVLKTKVELQNVSMKVQALELGRQTRYASLMALLGETRNTALTYELVPVEDVGIGFPIPETSSLITSALSQRGDLQALKTKAAAQRANASVIKGSRLPQVSVGGNFSGSHGGNIDFDETYWSVNATVSIPLLDMGRRKHLSTKAKMTARGAELDVLDLEDRIRAEVSAALASVVNARSNIATQQITLELATEVSRLEQLRYDSGRGDIDNLLKSKSGRSLAQASLAEARHNLMIALNSMQLTIEGECR